MKLNLIVAALLLASGSRPAGSITVAFSGTIFGSDTPGVAIGESFSGTMTYDPMAPVFGNLVGGVEYRSASPQDGIVIDVDGFAFMGFSNLEVRVEDSAYAPGLGVPNAKYIQGNCCFPGGLSNYPSTLGTLDEVIVGLFVNPSLVPNDVLPNPFNPADVILPAANGDPFVVAFPRRQQQDQHFFGRKHHCSICPARTSTLLLIGIAFCLLISAARSFACK